MVQLGNGTIKLPANETINQRVAKCRKLADLNQAEAAEKLGMKTSSYSQMERKGKISAERLLKLAQIFNVHPNVLLYGDAYMPFPEETQQVSISKPVVADDNTLLASQPITEPVTVPENIVSNSILTNTEENIIKIYRNLSKEDRAEVKAFILDKFKKR